MTRETSTEYKVAKVEVALLEKLPSQNQMLEIYALAKVAEGVDIKSRPAPGMFDFAGKEKQKAWKKHLDDGLTPQEAEKKYIELVDELKSTIGVRAPTDKETEQLEAAKAS